MSLALAGCGKNNAIDMNEIGENGRYNYKNPELGFSVSFPGEFIYYQTQRKNAESYTDLEFFVPTTDTKLVLEVPSYAKPVTVRVTKKDDWAKNGEDQSFKKMAEKGGRAYGLKFWGEIPSDWKAKWTNAIMDEIEASFKAM